jgi:xanthosine utilization system XapX-like protein
MPTQADELRQKLRELWERRAAGEVPARAFERRSAETGVALARAVASERLASDERILAEHHVVHSHFKLTGSVLQEPAQVAVSFFATNHRLLRLQATVLPGRPLTCDQSDGTGVDEMAYTRMSGIATRRQVRWGEAGAGLLCLVVAFLLRGALAVTGPMLALLGLVGMLHALLLPTRWVEIAAREGCAQAPFAIHAVRRKSGRGLLAVVRGAVAAWRGEA